MKPRSQLGRVGGLPSGHFAWSRTEAPGAVSGTRPRSLDGRESAAGGALVRLIAQPD